MCCIIHLFFLSFLFFFKHQIRKVSLLHRNPPEHCKYKTKESLSTGGFGLEYILMLRKSII
uniref:Uncharacterized protein n=1 Tax=Octopus bimaculoides TaxID=37653 RepID=A0A0L8FIP9_OCTBM